MPPTTGDAFWLIGLFAASIGLPFFALSANNPLLQAWFARTGIPPVQTRIFSMRPAISAASWRCCPIRCCSSRCSRCDQNLIWTGGYGLLIVLIASCGVLLLRSPAKRRIRTCRADEAAAPPSWTLRARWMVLAAVPSGLLVAVTAHISTDVAAVPLLWVLPLSLYLLTCVLVFPRGR